MFFLYTFLECLSVMSSYSVGISAGNSNQTWVPFHSSVDLLYLIYPNSANHLLFHYTIVSISTGFFRPYAISPPPKSSSSAAATTPTTSATAAAAVVSPLHPAYAPTAIPPSGAPAGYHPAAVNPYRDGGLFDFRPFFLCKCDFDS